MAANISDGKDMYTLFSKLILACPVMDYLIKNKTLKPTFKTTILEYLKAFAILELSLFLSSLKHRQNKYSGDPSRSCYSRSSGPQSLLAVKVAKSIFAPEF